MRFWRRQRVLMSIEGTTRRPRIAPLQHITSSIPSSNMSVSCQRAARRFALSASQTSAVRPVTCRFQVSRRWQSTEAAAAPVNPKISAIVDQISQLTLLETADLVSSLKVRRLVLLPVQA